MREKPDQPTSSGGEKSAPVGTYYKIETDQDSKASITPDDEKTYDSLNSESKGLLNEVYDKVNSSDLVQGAVDRFKVWKENKFHSSQRAESKINQLSQEQEMANNRVVDFKKSEDSSKANFEKAQKVLEDSNKAVKDTQEYIDNLETDLADIKKRNQDEQAKIDGEIEKIVQDIDAATIQFIKDTE